MAKEGEACSSVHLARDPPGLGVDAFGGAVAVRKCERGVHGVVVSVQAAGEGVQMGQVARTSTIQRASPLVFPARDVRRSAKPLIWEARWVISGQAAVSLWGSKIGFGR